MCNVSNKRNEITRLNILKGVAYIKPDLLRTKPKGNSLRIEMVERSTKRIRTQNYFDERKNPLITEPNGITRKTKESYMYLSNRINTI